MVTIFMPCFNTCFICGVQNCMLIESFFNKILMSNMASDAKACFSSKVEYCAVIRYLYLKGKTGKELHGELANVYGSSAPSYAQVMATVFFDAKSIIMLGLFTQEKYNNWSVLCKLAGPAGNRHS